MSTLAPLGFAIPAYRRPLLLDLALQSIVLQAGRIAAPIYIADDSCDQTNAAVVSKWQKHYGKIVHEINETNLGIDRNIDRAIVGCPASYVHVMGDDDLLLPGFADRALSIIDSVAPSHIVCSYVYLSNDYRTISGAVIPPQGSSVSMRNLLPHYGWALGFIGAHIFRRDRFEASNVNGFGTYFHHLIRLLRYTDPDALLGFIEAPLVGNRADDESTATWSGDRLTVVFGLEKALIAGMSQGYSKTEIVRAVAAARRCSGYTQYFRLLYWAALANRSGESAKYWATLSPLVDSAVYERLRLFPEVLYGPLLKLVPLVRRAKRAARRADLQSVPTSAS